MEKVVEPNAVIKYTVNELKTQITSKSLLLNVLYEVPLKTDLVEKIEKLIEDERSILRKLTTKPIMKDPLAKRMSPSNESDVPEDRSGYNVDQCKSEDGVCD
tara:strand:+ start:14323 stop:14628 length:306 start_codon:yes stop_codon:yes gene_type:complete